MNKTEWAQFFEQINDRPPTYEEFSRALENGEFTDEEERINPSPEPEPKTAPRLLDESNKTETDKKFNESSKIMIIVGSAILGLGLLLVIILLLVGVIGGKPESKTVSLETAQSQLSKLDTQYENKIAAAAKMPVANYQTLVEQVENLSSTLTYQQWGATQSLLSQMETNKQDLVSAQTAIRQAVKDYERDLKALSAKDSSKLSSADAETFQNQIAQKLSQSQAILVQSGSDATEIDSDITDLTGAIQKVQTLLQDNPPSQNESNDYDWGEGN